MKLGQWFALLSLIISLYILWQIRRLLLLLFTAIVLATALNLLVRKLQEFSLSRNQAIAVTLSSTLLLITLFFGLVVPPFIEQFQELVKLFPRVLQHINTEIISLDTQKFQWLPSLPTWGEIISQIQVTGLFQTTVSFFSNSVIIFLQLLFIFIFTLMLLANPSNYRSFLLLLFPIFYRRRAEEILDKCEIALGNWLAGITINCLFIGLSSGLGLWVLKIKLVLAHALLAGLLNFIPNIGPAASVVFPVMIAVLDNPWKIITILIWYFIIQNIETYWLSPLVMAKQVSLLPAVTLTAQIFFATVFGLLGLILALPLTVVAKTWIEELLFVDILDRWDSE